MFAKNLYRDDAVVAHARPEPLDGLVRVDPPHQFVVTRLSTGLAVVVLAWLVSGTTDHSLWLHGVPAEQWNATASSSVLAGEGGRRAELIAFVSARDARVLVPGMSVDVLSSRAASGLEEAGTVLSVSIDTGEVPSWVADRTGRRPGRSFLVRIAVPARAPGEEQAADDLQRLRIPLGRQSPLRFLTRQLP